MAGSAIAIVGTLYNGYGVLSRAATKGTAPFQSSSRAPTRTTLKAPDPLATTVA